MSSIELPFANTLTTFLNDTYRKDLVIACGNKKNVEKYARQLRKAFKLNIVVTSNEVRHVLTITK